MPCFWLCRYVSGGGRAVYEEEIRSRGSESATAAACGSRGQWNHRAKEREGGARQVLTASAAPLNPASPPVLLRAAPAWTDGLVLRNIPVSSKSS